MALIFFHKQRILSIMRKAGEDVPDVSWGAERQHQSVAPPQFSR
jgi:hypothetical protein